MKRRHFLQLAATSAAAMAMAPGTMAFGQTTAAASARDEIVRYFRPVVDGFLRNARATSPELVACDFPGGTKLKGCCTPSGKTYVSVARMLPALAAMGDNESLASIFRHAFDPVHPDFWGAAPADKPTQRTVESALVAYALATADRQMIADLTAAQRANIQKWLASCTQVTERKTNHAWFTALNHAARLELSRTFPEFAGDEAWMIEDLKALDAMYGNGTDGWYSDSPDQPIYDYYNFYVFAVFPLMWGRAIGSRYPKWNDTFRSRVKLFLEKAPYFFAADGSYPLMGRSLIYRWAILAPLVMGYQEKLWPHSPGLLRRIVRKNLAWHWELGVYDEKLGKLRETFSAEGSTAVRESYIDNGHPYWCMLAAAVLDIPADDPFWTAAEEPLPVEQGDFLVRFEGPKMLLSGRKHSGEVRWIQALNAPKRDVYRDKYVKFAWSSHFPFNVSGSEFEWPGDQTLIFEHGQTGERAARAPGGVVDGKLLADGVQTSWWAQLGKWRIDIVTRIRLLGDFEERTHHITFPPELEGKLEFIEGSHSLAAPATEVFLNTLRSSQGAIGMWRIGPQVLGGLAHSEGNLLYPAVVFLTHRSSVSSNRTRATLLYASPKPPPLPQVMREAEERVKQWTDFPWPT